jgi:hypothetical protein
VDQLALFDGLWTDTAEAFDALRAGASPAAVLAWLLARYPEPYMRADLRELVEDETPRGEGECATCLRSHDGRGRHCDRRSCIAHRKRMSDARRGVP